jgi:hypothetical protein
MMGDERQPKIRGIVTMAVQSGDCVIRPRHRIMGLKLSSFPIDLFVDTYIYIIKVPAF